MMCGAGAGAQYSEGENRKRNTVGMHICRHLADVVVDAFQNDYVDF
jgi:hypothetical protein